MGSNALIKTPEMDRLFQAVAQGNIALDNVPEELYHAFPAMSASGLREFRKGPGYFKHWRESENKDTQARLEGRLVHMALGEPARFRAEVIVVEGSRQSTAVRELIAAHRAAGKTVAKAEDIRVALETAAYCRTHPRIAEILASGVAERSFFWKDPVSGAQCKCRVDWITGRGAMVDWKTFTNVWDDDLLEYQIRSMGYQFQKAWYMEGFYRVYGRRALAFYSAFIRNEEPYDVAIRDICEHSIEEAIPYIQRALTRYAECVRTNEWPMTAPEVGEIEVKPYWK